MDLSGKWKQVGGAPADGGTYFIRQCVPAQNAPQSIFWHGHQDGGDAWSNVAFGSFGQAVAAGVEFGVNWADITDGSNRGCGALTLKVVDENTIEWIADNNGNGGTYFGGRKWVRS